jgi:hypothetical protein
MAVQNSGGGTEPTDFKPEESVLRHGQVHRTAGHRPVEPSVEHSDTRGTQHRAAASTYESFAGETMFDRARSRLTESSEGQ